jgi:syntaxin-binding protein 5
VGGPERPLPEKQAAAKAVSDRTTSASSLSSLSVASSGVGDLYSRLGAAISERGQMLDGLEDTVSSLQQGSSDMLAQVCVLLLISILSRELFSGEKAGCRAIDKTVV